MPSRHRNDLIDRNLAELVHCTVSDNPVPGVDQKANVTAIDGGEQRQKTLDITNEGELFSLDLIHAGIETDSQLNVSTLENFGDLRNSRDLNVKVLVIRQPIRRCGYSQVTARRTELLGKIGKRVKPTHEAREICLHRHRDRRRDQNRQS